MNEKEQLIDNMINKLIDTALSQVGYTETKGNITKYAKDFDNKWPTFYNGKKQGAAWCDIFVDWCFCTTFGEALALKMLYQPKKSCGAGCKFSYEYYKKNKATSKTPKKGYQIFFGKDCSHTGLVYKVDSKKVYTIEGNKSDSVKKCSYNLDSSKIYGYGIPDFGADLQIVDTKPEEPKEIEYITTASWLNVRYDKSTKSPIVGCLKKGTKVKGIKEGDWIKIGMHKYIFSKYAEPII